MVTLVLRNQAVICRPKRGSLHLDFHGRHVNGKLVAVEPIGLDDDLPLSTEQFKDAI